MADPGPGLQPERTALAWQRTALSGAVLAVLLARQAAVRESVPDMIAAVCAAIAVVLAAVFSRSVRAGSAPRLQLLAVMVAVVATGVCTTVGLLS